MPVDVYCSNPACKRRYRVPESAAGKSVRCKACGETFIASSARTQKSDDYIEPAWEPSASATQRPAAQTTFLPVGGTVGRFVIRGKVGSGAFGTVYLAYDPQLDRVVALKVPNPGVMDTPRRVERFLREAKAAAGLRHPHVVPVFDAGQDGDRYYIACAFIDGGRLSDAVPEGGMELPRAVRLARELAEALAYAHAEGVVHRDVKPQNVMLDKQDRVHLMDFGLAARQEEEARLTSDGTVMGTPAYMSPEQARGQKGEAQPSTDQYAAGVVLYELLTGRTPFTGPTPVVLHSVIHAEPDPPSRHRPEIPKDLETVCLKAMAKRPEDRYGSCQEFADDLRRWLEGEPVSARPLRPWERAARWLRRNKTVAAAAAAVLLSLSAAAALSVGSALDAQAEAKRADAQAQAATDAQRRAEESAEVAESARRQLSAALEEVRKERDLAGVAQKRADEERIRAVGSQKAAEAERDKADAALKVAEVERNKANEAVANLQAARDKLVRSEHGARTASYNLYLLLAHQQLLNEQTIEAVRTLGQCVPEQRGLEWRLLSTWADGGEMFARAHQAGGQVQQASFSGSGHRVALKILAGRAPSIAVYDTRTGAEVRDFQQGASLFQLNPDGTSLLAVQPDLPDTLMLVDVQTGAVTRKFVGPFRGQVRAAAFNPAGDRVVAAVADQLVAWELGKPDPLFSVKVGRASALGYSPDGGLIWMLSQANGQGEVRDAATGKPANGPVPAAADRALCVSPDGRFRVVQGSTDTVSVQDRATGRTVLGLSVPGGGTCAAYAPDGTRLLTGGNDGAVRLWDAASGAQLFVFGEPAEVRPRRRGNAPAPKEVAATSVVGVAALPDGSGFVAVFGGGTVKRWQVTNTARVTEVATKLGNPLVALSPDGGALAAISGEQGAQGGVWSLAGGQKFAPFPAGVQPLLLGGALAFSPNGRLLAVAAATPADPKAATPRGPLLLDAVTLQVVHQHKDLKEKAAIVGFGSAGKHLIQMRFPGEREEHCAAWDYATKRLTRGPPLGGRVMLAPQARAVVVLTVVGGKAKVVRLSETTLQPDKGSFDLPRPLANEDLCAASADGKLVAVSGKDSVTVWELGEKVRAIEMEKGPDKKAAVDGARVVFGRRNEWLAGGCPDGFLRLWDPATGELLTAVRAHDGPIVSLSATPDGKWIATADGGGLVKVWRVAALLEAAQ